MARPFCFELGDREGWKKWCSKLASIDGAATYSLLNDLARDETLEKYAWKHQYEVRFFYKDNGSTLKDFFSHLRTSYDYPPDRFDLHIHHPSHPFDCSRTLTDITWTAHLSTVEDPLTPAYPIWAHFVAKAFVSDKTWLPTPLQARDVETDRHSTFMEGVDLQRTKSASPELVLLERDRDRARAKGTLTGRSSGKRKLDASDDSTDGDLDTDDEDSDPDTDLSEQPAIDERVATRLWFDTDAVKSLHGAVDMEKVIVGTSLRPEFPSSASKFHTGKRTKQGDTQVKYIQGTKDLFRNKKPLVLDNSKAKTVANVVSAAKADVRRAAAQSNRLRYVVQKLIFQVQVNGNVEDAMFVIPESALIEIRLYAIEDGRLAARLAEVALADAPKSEQEKKQDYRRRIRKFGAKLDQLGDDEQCQWSDEWIVDKSFKATKTKEETRRGSLPYPKGPIFPVAEQLPERDEDFMESVPFKPILIRKTKLGFEDRQADIAALPKASTNPARWIAATPDTDVLDTLKKVYLEKGKFNKHWKRHFPGVKDPLARAPHTTETTRRPWYGRIELDKTGIWVGVATGNISSPNPKIDHVVIGCTRESGTVLRYGLEGMHQRAVAAARAWSKVSGFENVLTIGWPRRSVSSLKARFEDNAVRDEYNGPVNNPPLINDLLAVLDAAKYGRTINIVIVGIDAFTTLLDNYVWLATKYCHKLKIRLVFVVPAWFPGDFEVFPQAQNGIRYGIFDLKGLTRTISEDDKDEHNQTLLGIFRTVNRGKRHDKGRQGQWSFTRGRGTFRVCPETANDEAVDPVLLGTRMLIRPIDLGRDHYHEEA